MFCTLTWGSEIQSELLINFPNGDFRHKIMHNAIQSNNAFNICIGIFNISELSRKVYPTQ